MSWEIIVQNHTGPFRPGDKIEGIVQSPSTESNDIEGIRLKLRGIESTTCFDWEDAAITEDPLKYYARNKFLKIDQFLHKPNPAVSEYPFRLVLPKDSPSSVETNYGGVKYYLVVPLDSEQHTDSVSVDKRAVKNIYVSGLIDLNDMPGLKMSRSQYSDEKQVPDFCCGTPGTVILDVYLDKEGFTSGESISVTAVIKNTSDRYISRIWAKLEQRFTTPYSKTKCESFLIDSKMTDGVRRVSEQTYNFLLNIPKSIKIFNLRSCRLIKQRFILQVTAEFGTYGENLKVQIPLVIGHIPFIGGISQSTHPVNHMAVPGGISYPPIRGEEKVAVTKHMAVPGGTPYPPTARDISNETTEVYLPSAPLILETE